MAMRTFRLCLRIVGVLAVFLAVARAELIRPH